jgi:hypothetical protein
MKWTVCRRPRPFQSAPMRLSSRENGFQGVVVALCFAVLCDALAVLCDALAVLCVMSRRVQEPENARQADCMFAVLRGPCQPAGACSERRVLFAPALPAESPRP